MSIAIYATLSVLIVSLVSLIGVFTLSLNTQFLSKVLFLLVSLAVGALFGDAIFHLMPEAFEHAATDTASLFIIAGILAFFVLEKFLLWRHSHGERACENPRHIESEVTRTRPLGTLVIASDGIHNFIDGFIIGASYLISTEVGIATTIAIILHEIPQEIGDFGLLIHAGISKGKALFINFLSALTALAGLAIALAIGTTDTTFTALATAFAAGSFIYIAGADLVPELHKVTNVRRSLLQLAFVLIGIAAMWLLLFIE